jgi:hypothetical protein
VTRVNVEGIAFTDPRFSRLAKLLGLTDGDHARSKVEYLWLACTIRGELELPRWLIEEHLGPSGPEAMIEAELGRWAGGRGDSNTRRMYICGSRGRTEWYARNQRQSSKGGKARASSSSRVGGRFAPDPAGDFTSALPPALPLAHAHPPERESAGEIATGQLSETGSDPPLPPEPSAESAEQQNASGLQTLKNQVDQAAPIANTRNAHPRAPDPRIRINHDAWSYAAGEHAKLRAAGIDPTAIAWSPIPTGVAQAELVARTRELTQGDRPDFTEAARVHRRRVDVAVAEARREKHLRWFTPSRFYTPESFWKAAETSPEQAAIRRGPISRADEDKPIRMPDFSAEEGTA